VLLLAVGPAVAQDSLRHEGGQGEGDHYDLRFDTPDRYADDIEPSMLRYVHDPAAQRDRGPVDTVHAAPSDPHLPPSSVDRILTVNTWHHIGGLHRAPRRATAVRRLAGGRAQRLHRRGPHRPGE
jgi:hypothetical protein